MEKVSTVRHSFPGTQNDHFGGDENVQLCRGISKCLFFSGCWQGRAESGWSLGCSPCSDSSVPTYGHVSGHGGASTHVQSPSRRQSQDWIWTAAYLHGVHPGQVGVPRPELKWGSCAHGWEVLGKTLGWSGPLGPVGALSTLTVCCLTALSIKD